MAATMPEREPQAARGGRSGAARERLLDAAMRLVAESGFDGPSVRDIAAAADTRLASISELFGGRDGLILAMVERRSLALAEERLARLGAARAQGPVTLEGVAAAFIEPLFDHMAEDEDWRVYARVSAQLVSSARWDGRIGPVLETEAAAFIDAISAAQPGLDRAEAAWCFTFLMGALATATSGTGWIAQLSEGVVEESEFATLKAALIAYIPAAIRSVAARIDMVRAESRPIPKPRSTKTRDRILDVAERLFATHGFHGISMRKIADAADISVGLCHYHFKTKEGVFLAMCLRRHPEINEERWQMLEEAKAMEPGRERLAAVVDAYLGTPARRLEKGGRGWRDHLRAMATAITSHGDYWLETLRVVSDDIVHAIVEESAKAGPGLSLRKAYIAHLFVNGLVATGYSGGGRVDRLSGGAARSSDYQTMYVIALRFHVGGLLGMAGAREV